MKRLSTVCPVLMALLIGLVSASLGAQTRPSGTSNWQIDSKRADFEGYTTFTIRCESIADKLVSLCLVYRKYDKPEASSFEIFLEDANHLHNTLAWYINCDKIDYKWDSGDIVRGPWDRQHDISVSDMGGFAKQAYVPNDKRADFLNSLCSAKLLSFRFEFDGQERIARMDVSGLVDFLAKNKLTQDEIAAAMNNATF